MSANMYCEPCRRLLRGQLHVIDQTNCHVKFDHHIDFESFDKAMRLPCSICGFAYTHAKNYPSDLNWVKLVGFYLYDSNDDERLLYFYPDGGEEEDLARSAHLILKPWSSG
jgi:hypothetical protein